MAIRDRFWEQEKSQGKKHCSHLKSVAFVNPLPYPKNAKPSTPSSEYHTAGFGLWLPTEGEQFCLCRQLKHTSLKSHPTTV